MRIKVVVCSAGPLRNLGKELSKPEFVSDLKLLASSGLMLDTYIPNPALITDLVRLTDKAPSLRVVIEHLPELDPPKDSQARNAFQATLRELGKRPQVYVKLSALLRRVDGRVPQDLYFYSPLLDELSRIPANDDQLRHATRMSLRNQLRDQRGGHVPAAEAAD